MPERASERARRSRFANLVGDAHALGMRLRREQGAPRSRALHRLASLVLITGIVRGE
jgi:hypothetical protein